MRIFRANLTIVKELGDRAAQGRTYGNLGNTHYLLGNFRKAVASHEQVWCISLFIIKANLQNLYAPLKSIVYTQQFPL